MIPKWFQNDSKMIPKWSQHDPKRILEWSQHDPKMIPKWSQNNPKMIPKRIPKWSNNDPKTISKWSQNDFKIIPKLVYYSPGGRAQKVISGGAKTNESFWKSQNNIKKLILRFPSFLFTIAQAPNPRGNFNCDGVFALKKQNARWGSMTVLRRSFWRDGLFPRLPYISLLRRTTIQANPS